MFRLIVTGTTNSTIFPTICSICQLIWSLLQSKRASFAYQEHSSSNEDAHHHWCFTVKDIYDDARTALQGDQTNCEHLVQCSWVKEVKQRSLQWWQDHCKRLHLLAPTYRHLEVFQKPIWFGAGLLNELYHGDTSRSTAVKLQSRQMKEEVKGGKKKQVLNTTLHSPVEKLNTLTASTGIEMETADSDAFSVCISHITRMHKAEKTWVYRKQELKFSKLGKNEKQQQLIYVPRCGWMWVWQQFLGLDFSHR